MADKVLKRVMDNATASDRVRAEAAKVAAELAETNAKASEEQALASANALSAVTFDRGFSGDNDLTVVPTTTGATEGDISWYLPNNDSFQIIRLESGVWQDFGEPITTKKYVDDKASLLESNIAEEVKTGVLSANDDYPKEDVTALYGINAGTSKDVSPIVSFIDDDGNSKLYTNLKPIFDAQGITGGIALPTNAIGGAGVITWDQAREFQTDGWEILSHLAGGNLSDPNPETTLKDSRDKIESEGLTVRNVVPVQGEEGGTEGRRLTRKYYRASFKTSGEINTVPINHVTVNRINFVENGGTQPPLTELKAHVDDAVTNDGWCVFTIHSGYPDFDATAEQKLNDLIDYIQAQGVDIVNPNEGLNRIGNIIDIGDEEFTSKYLKIDPTGEVHSSTIFRYFEGESANGRDGNSPPSDFTNGQVTHMRITSGDSYAGYPIAEYGYLTTGRRSDPFVFQEYFSIPSNRKFIRTWDDSVPEWREWQELGSGVVDLGPDFTGGAANINALLAVDYPDTGKIFRQPIWTGTDKTGLPEASLGVLITNLSRYSDRTLTYQEFHIRRADKVYRRQYQGGSWNAWVQIVGGATGSFTTSDSKTVTVENGLITAIT